MTLNERIRSLKKQQFQAYNAYYQSTSEIQTLQATCEHPKWNYTIKYDLDVGNPDPAKDWVKSCEECEFEQSITKEEYDSATKD